MSTGNRAGERGQAAVELVALLPVLLVVALAIAQLLAAGAAREQAALAAQAGAAALLQEGDAEDEARAAMPSRGRRSVDVRVRGRVVTVVVRPRRFLPGFGSLLDVRARADAGPPS